MSVWNKKPLTFKISEAGCWEVTSHGRGSSGYPLLRVDGTRVLTHRHVWRERFGEIPPGMFVCHRCDNKICINPEHLFLGTQADNMHDCVAKGRQARGERIAQAKLTASAVQEIRRRHRPGDGRDGGRALAREFGVSRRTAQQVISGETWGWVGPRQSPPAPPASPT